MFHVEKFDLLFIAFLYYNFQKPVGSRAPTAPTVMGPLLIHNFGFPLWNFLSDVARNVYSIVTAIRWTRVIRARAQEQGNRIKL